MIGLITPDHFAPRDYNTYVYFINLTNVMDFYCSVSALLLLYDVTNKTSFDNIRAWLGEIREYAQDDVVIMLLGRFFLNTSNHVK